MSGSSSPYQNGDVLQRALAQLQEQSKIKDLVIAAQDQLLSQTQQIQQQLEERLTTFESHTFTPVLYTDNDQTMGFWKSNAAVGLKITGTVQRTSEGLDSIQPQNETLQRLPAIREVEEEQLGNANDDDGLKDLIEDFASLHVTEIEEAQSKIDRIKTKFQAEMTDLVARYHGERLAHAALVENLKHESQQTNDVYFGEIQTLEKEHQAEMDRLAADHRVELTRLAADHRVEHLAQMAENEELQSRRQAQDAEISKVKEELATAKELIGHLIGFITLQYEGKMPLKGEKRVDM